MILLIACAVAISILRRPDRKIAVPAAMAALLLGIGCVLLVAPQMSRHAAIRATPIDPNWSSHPDPVRHVSMRPYPDPHLYFGNGQPVYSHTVQGPEGMKRLFLIIPTMLAIALCVTFPILGRKWILRHDRAVTILLRTLVVGLPLTAIAIFGLYFMRSTQWVAASQQAQLVATDRAIAATLDRIHPILQPAADATAADRPADAATPRVELPEWIRNQEAEINHIDRNPAVLASEQWSSVQESEIQMEELAAAAVAHQLRQFRPGLSGWNPDKSFIHQSGAIRQRFVEQTSLKVGDFESPMYRAYWQVAVTPQASDLAFAQWKAETVERRVIWLGAGAGALTLLFAAIAAALRIDVGMFRRYRGRTVAAAVGMLTMLGAAAFAIV